MSKNEERFEHDSDSMKDVTEFQNNQYNPGHYIGTGRVPPTVSAPGNAMPLVILYFLGAALFVAIGLALLFSDISVTSSGLIESPLANKIISAAVMGVIAAVCAVLGFAYLRKAKVYRKQKAALKRESLDETVNDQIWQITCPQCGHSHDMDYPKCPHCKFDYRA